MDTFLFGSPEQWKSQLTDMTSQKAILASRHCIKHKSWDHLQVLVDGGFDVAASHKVGLVDETLIHLCIREHLYDEMHFRIEKLLDMGADPHRVNGQGVTPLGLLCGRSQDMPDRAFFSAFEVLEKYGVRLTDSCGKEELARFLMNSPSALEILKERCPDHLPWAQAKILDYDTADATAALARPRL